MAETESLERMEARIRDGLPPDEQFVIEALKDGIATEAFVRSDAGRALLSECVRCGISSFKQLMDAGLDEAQERRALADLRVHVGMLRMLSRMIASGLGAERQLTAGE